MGKIFIGTSGWVYPHWKSLFYPEDLPEKEWLRFYADHFSTVELNSSFYHLPKEKTFKGWYDRTPDDFVFAVKGSRFITHVKKLKNCREPLENLLQAAANLREKLGPVFFQLPSSFEANPERLRAFIKLLPDKEQPCQANPKGLFFKSPTLRVKRDWRFAFEFRHSSWFTDEIYAILRKANCALIASDTPSYPYAEVSTANFMYLRLHGHEQLYTSNYSQKQLKEYVEKIKEWRKVGDVFVFFDNDFEANAVKNAKELNELLR
ncbi:DUF72 domain-containing protein [candidate division WWE3 bacterium CG09_land_8_20_14_0_10_47_33]|nr:DUF72 domain-containing protein [bacterium]PIS12491.1 MAG: DUF72 domain-containing protein [candidate division WWE3 bacterium CG09_land_8_20_14_0_10_47_33]PIZ41436.1 MAG: DUF72 domain-containing protein [candidate division WWE3 bacterium CG_4_10_14_0_2_um_filter_47_8]PJE50429.1 MAG: hypothetical protein COV28_03090 [candidate division WWE3 bacterium CG10_big_fil_rev_8_21_14_0_10_48_23]